jgi:hypothetical protein
MQRERRLSAARTLRDRQVDQRDRARARELAQ